MDDVIPFLENVTRGRNVPRERLEEVAHHYALFGGRQPDQRPEPRADRRAPPRARRHGSSCRSTSATATGTRSSPTRCGRWPTTASSARSPSSPPRTPRTRAAASTGRTCSTRSRTVGPRAPEVLRTRSFFNHPGWIEANADHVRAALAQLGAGDAPHLAFTAHSIPLAMARACRYVDQLRESSRLVAESVGLRRLGARLPEPQRPAARAVARARRRRSPAAVRARGVDERRDLADRLRLRPPGGALRPRRRGAGRCGRSSASSSSALRARRRTRRSSR